MQQAILTSAEHFRLFQSMKISSILPQGRGKGGLSEQQLEAFDAAVALLEENGGLKVWHIQYRVQPVVQVLTYQVCSHSIVLALPTPTLEGQ